MHRWPILLLAVFMALVSGSGTPDAQAQDSRELSPFVTFEGQISDPNEAETWTFTALAGEVVSLLVEGDGSFDPVLLVLDDSGNTMIANDDLAYPSNRDALVEAITLPRTGTYTVQVSGFDEMTGTYALTLLHGYADIAYENAVDNAGWAAAERGLEIEADDTLTVSARGINISGAVQNPRLSTVDDAYAELTVGTIEARNDWEAGLVLRQQGSQHIRVKVNARGQWQASFASGSTVAVIRDWTAHPAIVPGETNFVLGVLAIGSAFDVFYNGQFIGQFIEPQAASSGRLGVVIGTADAIESFTEVRFDRLTITRPLLANGAPIFPQQLIPGSTSQLIQELERRRVIPAGGRNALTVNESFVDSVRPGIALLDLGRGATFSTFAMGTTTRLNVNSGDGPTGCGLLLRRTGESTYTVAYIDNSGAYGLSERAGETFDPGIFGETPAFAANTEQSLLVVATADRLHLFVNRRYAGSLRTEAIAGEVGNALVNFEASNATCNFTETWVWAWD